MYIGPARNEKEVKAACALAAKVFESLVETSKNDMAEFKNFLWKESGCFQQDHISVIVDSENNVIGTARLVPRRMFCGITNYSVAGISSVCIDEKYRGQGYSVKILESTLEQAKNLGYDIVLLFARRALDYYYSRFNIWGLSSYNTIKIEKSSLSKIKQKKIQFDEPTLDDITVIQEWHSSSYQNCFGYIERDNNYWQFLIKKLHRLSADIKILRYNSHRVGYVVKQKGIIVELAFELDSKNIWLSCLKAIESEDDYLIMKLPDSHPIIKKLDPLDVTISYRQCQYGGHMIGILNLEKIYRKLEERIKRVAKDLNTRPMTEKIDGILLKWDGRDALVRRLEDKKLEVETVSRLLGARLLNSSEMSVLAPCKAFNFSEIDEF